MEVGEDCSQSAESECCSGICVDGLTCGAATFPELTYVSNGETNGFYKECEGEPIDCRCLSKYQDCVPRIVLYHRISNFACLTFPFYPAVTMVHETGDCDRDEDCLDGLVCYQSDISDGIVPGCSGKTSGTTDYCFTPTVHTGNLPLTFIGDELSAYGECQGDCDADSEVSQFVLHRFALFLPSN